ECGKSFVIRFVLVIHQWLRTEKHPSEHPVCGKSFGKSSNLQRRRWIHTGEKPYPCPVCGNDC
ncbi:ZN345 protein, partial [Stercorarius parasiticus]|nr:ZN345 protein [Stercorarius parasiticus]